MTLNLKQVGCQLVEDSNLNEEFSAQRGLINDMFPYIYVASKRMSSRAISRWLLSNKIKLSAATVAKALREPKPYWNELLEEVEPAARIFADAHNIEPSELLEKPDLFSLMESRTPTIEGVTNDGAMNFLSQYQGSVSKLKSDWFALPQEAREACLTYAQFGHDAK